MTTTLVILMVVAPGFLVWGYVIAGRREDAAQLRADELQARETREYALRVRKYRLEIRLLKQELERKSKPFE